MSKKALCLVLLFVLILLQLWVYAQNQPRIALGNGRGDDGVHYGLVAEQLARAETPKAAAPFVYRVGVPWLAGGLSLLTPLSVDAAFQSINFFAYLALILAIYALALRFCAPPFAVLACLLYSIPFHGFARLIFFYPLNVDIVWLALVFGGLALMTSRLTKIHLIVLILLCILAALVRENGLILPATFVFSRHALRRFVSLEALLGLPAAPTPRDTAAQSPQQLRWGLLMLVGGLMTVAFTRWLCEPTNAYSNAAKIIKAVENNAAWHLFVSFFLANGGPLLGVLLIKREVVTQLLRAYPEFTVYLLLSFVLAYVGGVATIRFLNWVSPVVLIMVAGGLEAIFEETRSWRRAPVKYLRLGIVLLLLLLNWAVQYPFQGYYDDYRAWVQWGGVWFADIGSLKPVLLSALATVAALLLWNVVKTPAAKSAG